MPIYFAWFTKALLSVVVMRTIKTYRKVGAFYIAWEEDFLDSYPQVIARQGTDRLQNFAKTLCTKKLKPLLFLPVAVIPRQSSFSRASISVGAQACSVQGWERRTCAPPEHNFRSANHASERVSRSTLKAL